MSQNSNFISVPDNTFAGYLNVKQKLGTMKKLISWVEIPGKDIERAVKFYNALFNLDLQILDFGEEKMACFPNNEGAISWAENFTPSQNGVLVSFNAVDKLKNSLARIQENGGTVVQGKTKIDAEDRGYFALFIDSEGNKIGLYGDE